MRYKAGIVLWQGKQRLDLLSVLPQVTGERLELLVAVGADKVVSGVRLVAERVRDEVTRQRQERIRAYADDHGKPVNPLVWELAHWTIVLTNVPVCMLSFEQVLALLRARWQVELLFKLWKESGLLDDWEASDPWRSLSAVAEVLREQVPTLVHGLLGHLPLGRAIGLILDSVQGGCSIPKRSTRLSTSYRLLGPWEPGLT